MQTIKTIADRRCSTRAGALFACVLAGLMASGCSVLPKPPARPDVYDFGPGTVVVPAPDAAAALAPLALADVETVGLPEGSSALLYRLVYANAQQLQPYSQARWSQPPALLVQQALRAHLGAGRAVLSGDDGLATLLQQDRMPTVLRAQLEEFSQVFESPAQSHGLLRLRVSVADASARGETLVAQRVFEVRRPAPSADAAGGARALSEAAAQAATEVAAWLRQLGR
ncbi:ABC-type transport auxiliary lipoprotein family protein [Oryzisolibacter propanilivorax]|nr:ABC-type transport auxiliary lipoprotein family protein [Oryzisolibacter propanilivorax]